jgi:hypothetical protein
VFEDRDIAQIDATVIVGVLILASMTTINPNIPERLRISEAFAITWEMILPFAISGVIALAGHKDCENPYCCWICTYDHNVICGMARNLRKMNQPLIVRLILEKLFASSKGLITFNIKETVKEIGNVKIVAFPSHATVSTYTVVSVVNLFQQN